jgi:hypothetical protein
MIKTDFEKYCDNCDELEPVADIETVQYFNGSKTLQLFTANIDTDVRK